MTDNVGQQTLAQRLAEESTVGLAGPETGSTTADAVESAGLPPHRRRWRPVGRKKTSAPRPY